MALDLPGKLPQIINEKVLLGIITKDQAKRLETRLKETVCKVCEAKYHEDFCPHLSDARGLLKDSLRSWKTKIMLNKDVKRKREREKLEARRKQLLEETKIELYKLKLYLINK